MTILYLLILSLLISVNKADLPVHCLAKQIQGDWDLFVVAKQPGINLDFVTCGHHHPDQNTDHLNFDFKALFKKIQPQKLKVKLVLPNIVLYTDEKGQQIKGEWTMIYDEGFQVTLQDKIYFAFSKYKQTTNMNPQDQDDEQTGGYASICGETFLGWAYDDKQKQHLGCFYAEQTSSNIEMENISSEMQIEYKMQNSNKEKIVEKSQEELNQIRETKSIFASSFLQTPADKQGFLEKFMSNQILYEMPHKEMFEFDEEMNFLQNSQTVFQHDLSFVEKINNENSKSPWKAKVYDHFSNQTHAYMKKLLGITPHKQGKLSQIYQKVLPQKKIPATSFLETKAEVFMNKRKNRMQSFLQMQFGAQDQVVLKHKNNTDQVQKSSNKNDDNIFEKLESEFKNFLHNIGEKKDQQNTEQNSNEQQVLKNIKKQLNEEEQKKVCGKSNTDIPRCYDIRDIDGVNYDTPVKHQGDCGSCYIVSALSALESRIRIKSNNKHKPNLSINGALSCGSYTQGCNGGYPELVAKFGKEQGFYLNTCDTLNFGEESDQHCMDTCFNKKDDLWFVKDFGYVGKGYYGSTDEESMMKEIYENGPIVVALNAAPDLYYYSSGVFITNAQEPLIQDNGNPQVAPWQFTNHAVTCIGWGESMHEGQIIKYWILKNSWGEDWGESGYFKMLRGVNLAAIENQAIYLDPLMKN